MYTPNPRPEPESGEQDKLLDNILLTAVVAFAEEFRVDRARRELEETIVESQAGKVALSEIRRELDEIEVRASRVDRLLLTTRLQRIHMIVRGYSLIDLRRINTALERVQRHLLTLYPEVSETSIESVRQMIGSIDEIRNSDVSLIRDKLRAVIELSVEIRSQVAG